MCLIQKENSVEVLMFWNEKTQTEGSKKDLSHDFKMIYRTHITHLTIHDLRVFA